MSKGLKRWLVRIAIVVALLIGLPLLANLYCLYGVSDFEEYLRESPVAEEVIAERFPTDAATLTDASRWQLGAVDPFSTADGSDGGSDEDGERVTWTGKTRFRVLRGTTELGHALVEARATAPDGRIRDGFALRVTQLRSAEHLRAVVIAVVENEDELIGPDAVARGSVSANLLLVAGDGPDEAHLLSGAETVHLPHDVTRFGSLLGMGLRLLFPIQSPPSEGFWLHLRGGFGFTAEERESSSSGGSLTLSSFDTSTEIYSFEAEIDSEFFDDPDNMMTSKGRVKVERSLFGTRK